MKIVGNLRKAINESKERILLEAKKKELAKAYTAGKGGKVLPLGSSDITRVEAKITDKDLPKEIYAELTRAAQSVVKLNDEVKAANEQLTKDKEFLRPLFDDLFAEGDKVITRVLKTVIAGKKGKMLELEITSGKAGTNTKFDHKQFVSLLKANLKDQIKLIEKLAEQCTKISETANSIRVDIEEVKESTLNESVIASITKKLTSLVKNAIASVTKYIKDALKVIDARQKEINSFLTPELREEANDALVQFGIMESMVNEANDFTNIDDIMFSVDKILTGDNYFKGQVDFHYNDAEKTLCVIPKTTEAPQNPESDDGIWCFTLTK